MYKTRNFPGLYPNRELFTSKEKNTKKKRRLSKLNKIVITYPRHARIMIERLDILGELTCNTLKEKSM